MKENRTLRHFLTYLLREIFRQKKWYLLPLWVFLIALALVLLVSGTSFLIPAIYIAI